MLIQTTWKTTLAGILTFLAVLVATVLEFLNTGTVSGHSIGVLFAGFTAFLGLLHAQDKPVDTNG